MGQLLRSLVVLAASLAADAALAQAFPAKPIRVIVGFPAGSGTDVAARILSVPLQAQLGQPVVIENRPGAAGAIGAAAVAKADPDGYLLYFGSAEFFHPVMLKSGALDAAREFAPISDSMSAPLVFWVSAKIPVQSFQELLAYSRANPEKLNAATALPQDSLMLAMVRNASGFSYTEVTGIQGTLQLMPLLISGEIAVRPSLYGTLAAARASGIVRPLFVTAPARVAQYRDIPTASEVGLPKTLESIALTFGYWAPKATPGAVTARLTSAAMAAARATDTVERFHKVGYEAVGSSAEEQLKKFESNMAMWAEAARIAKYEQK